MKELRIDVRNKIATYNSRGGAIVCGNKDYYRIRFSFDSEWDEFPAKQARFIWNDKYLDVVFTGDVVTVPMLSQATSLTVGVYAGEKLRTTTPANIPCMLSIICESEKVQEADYYEAAGSLQFRLPPIRNPQDDGKLLQANNGVYELKTFEDLNYGGEFEKIRFLVTGNTWVLKDRLSGGATRTFDFNFISNGEFFDQIETRSDYAVRLRYRKIDGNYMSVYENSWLNRNYQTIFTENDIALDDIAVRASTDAALPLETNAKTIIKAINELNERVQLYPAYYSEEKRGWFEDAEFTIPITVNRLGKFALIDISAFEFNVNIDGSGVLIEFNADTLKKLWSYVPEDFRLKVEEWANSAADKIDEKFGEIHDWSK